MCKDYPKLTNLRYNKSRPANPEAGKSFAYKVWGGDSHANAKLTSEKRIVLRLLCGKQETCSSGIRDLLQVSCLNKGRKETERNQNGNKRVGKGRSKAANCNKRDIRKNGSTVQSLKYYINKSKQERLYGVPNTSCSLSSILKGAI